MTNYFYSPELLAQEITNYFTNLIREYRLKYRPRMMNYFYSQECRL